ncbi:acyl-CoA thioesterase [Amnibacterium setariae]|uniref:Acyl-CoA thioesterase n=2 Tax=Amnibacterium setariae TaxID=2306585 RepID=A0A3A1TXJ6_9MICO|nr:acyl-CoA thioesterase [Amnibacterium setariae]
MHMWFRTLLVRRTWRRRSRLAVGDVGRLGMRALPTDIDVFGHVNNGKYLSLMDIGRWDLLLRTGLWRRMVEQGLYPVVSSSTMTYRKSLRLGQRFVLESRITGYDERSVFMEQRFTVDGEVFARGVVRGVFLRRSGGVVRTAELGELLGVDTATAPPDPWLQDWAAAVALPSTRSAAPSVWV